MDNKNRLYRLIALIAGGVVLAGAVIFVLLLFASTSEEPEAVFGDDGLTILGQYGETILYSEITDISLEDGITKIGYKRDGASLGEIKRGKFEVEGMGTCRLFIMSETGPFVVFNTKNGYVIINYKDPEKTKQLYEELSRYAG